MFLPLLLLLHVDRVLQSRVSECQQRVNDLIDLKLCSDGVQTALAEEDYEQAAAHVHRFLDMDEGDVVS